MSVPRKETHAKLVQYLTDHPDVPYKAVSAKLGVSIGTISRIATTHGLRRGKRVTLLPEKPPLSPKVSTARTNQPPMFLLSVSFNGRRGFGPPCQNAAHGNYPNSSTRKDSAMT